MRMQGYCGVYKWTILKRTSPEVKCLHLTSSRREMCTLSVSNVIYHKFSHGAAFYMFNGKNVNVMLESLFTCCCSESFLTFQSLFLFSDFAALIAKSENKEAFQRQRRLGLPGCLIDMKLTYTLQSISLPGE